MHIPTTPDEQLMEETNLGSVTWLFTTAPTAQNSCTVKAYLSRRILQGCRVSLPPFPKVMALMIRREAFRTQIKQKAGKVWNRK